jgi:hypothetical protein
MLTMEVFLWAHQPPLNELGFVHATTITKTVARVLN